MSRESRDRLLALWQNTGNDKHLRSQAFRLWAATSEEAEDLKILRAVDPNDLLADPALRQRLVRNDQAAIPQMLKKLTGGDRPQWWHMGHWIWSDELTRALDEELHRRGNSVAEDWGAKFETDYQTYELIMRLPSDQAEALLVKHWNHLRYCEYFVQTALYVATSRLLNLAKQAVEENPKPEQNFEHIGIHYGIRTKGRVGVTRRAQIEALIPYLDLLNEHAIFTFWDVCNDHGWFDLRRKYFDEKLSEKYNGHSTDEKRIFARLDSIENHNFHWIDRDIEDFLKRGVPLDQIMKIIAKWLAGKRTFGALKVAATAVMYAGKRKDLDILDVVVEPKDQAEALLKDTRFAVQRRSLH